MFVNSIGAIIVAIFAIFWTAAGAHEFNRRWFAFLLAMSILISVSIVLVAMRVPFARSSRVFDGRIYGIFVAFEAIAIAVAAVILNRTGHKQFLIPVIALIVGVHFFGMVPALHSNKYWWIGGAMCALSILPRNIWTPIVGLGCAIILWSSAICAFF
jgi:hypothetical protein